METKYRKFERRSELLGRATPLCGATDEDTDESPVYMLQSGLPLFAAKKGYVEITISHPYTDSFTILSSDKQKKLYDKIWTETMAAIGIEHKETHRHVYEFNKAGMIHCHGYVTMSAKPFFVNGLLADLAKAVHKQMPVKKYQNYHTYKPRALDSDKARYYTPQVVLQYRYDGEMRDGKNAFTYWCNYLDKDILPDM